jgi:flagellar biosynthesis protein FliP
MSCCENKPTPTSKSEFLKQKAHNFREFLLKQNPSDDVKKFVETFDESKINYTILTTLVPIKQMGTADIMVDELMAKLNISDSAKPEVKAKILRYFDMFVEVFLT